MHVSLDLKQVSARARTFPVRSWKAHSRCDYPLYALSLNSSTLLLGSYSSQCAFAARLAAEGRRAGPPSSRPQPRSTCLCVSSHSTGRLTSGCAGTAQSPQRADSGAPALGERATATRAGGDSGAQRRGPRGAPVPADRSVRALSGHTGRRRRRAPRRSPLPPRAAAASPSRTAPQRLSPGAARGAAPPQAARPAATGVAGRARRLLGGTAAPGTGSRRNGSVPTAPAQRCPADPARPPRAGRSQRGRGLGRTAPQVPRRRRRGALGPVRGTAPPRYRCCRRRYRRPSLTRGRAGPAAVRAAAPASPAGRAGPGAGRCPAPPRPPSAPAPQPLTPRLPGCSSSSSRGCRCRAARPGRPGPGRTARPPRRGPGPARPAPAGGCS